MASQCAGRRDHRRRKTPYQQVPSFDRQPGTFSVSDLFRASDQLGLSPDHRRHPHLRDHYLVEGAVRNYPNEDPGEPAIWWTAISSELTNTAPVLESTTTITLTQPVDPAQVVAGTENLPIEPTTTDNQTWTWKATDLRDGDDLTVRLQFPPLVNVATPSWQARMTSSAPRPQANDDRNAIYNLAFLALGGLAALSAHVALWTCTPRAAIRKPVRSLRSFRPRRETCRRARSAYCWMKPLTNVMWLRRWSIWAIGA